MPRGATATSVAAPSGAAASSMPPTAATAAEHRLHYEERGSLSRGSVGKGSLGRYSVTTESSVATRHWVNSVSDIYGPDEIEELLDDLNRLELAAFETDDIQDFVIDGSQVGRERHHHVRRGPRGRLRAEAQGGGGPEYRYPSPSAGSPTSSVCSWDSHQVRHHAPQRQVFEVDAGTEGDNDDDDDDCDLEDGLGAQLSAGNGYSSNPSRPMQSIRCFCDTLTFRTPRTILRVLLVLTSIACLTTVLSAGTAKMGLFLLPHFPRLRILLFICIFTILFTAFVLFLNISHLNENLPFEFGRVQTLVYLLLSISFLVVSSLILQVHSSISSYETVLVTGGTGLGLDVEEEVELTFWTKYHLLIAAILGFACSFETFLCIFNCGPTRPSSYNKVQLQESSTNFTLQSRPGGTSAATATQPLPPLDDSGGGGGGSVGRRAATSVSQQHLKQQQYLVNENFSPPPSNNSNSNANTTSQQPMHRNNQSSSHQQQQQHRNGHSGGGYGSGPPPPQQPPPPNTTTAAKTAHDQAAAYSESAAAGGKGSHIDKGPHSSVMSHQHQHHHHHQHSKPHKSSLVDPLLNPSPLDQPDFFPQPVQIGGDSRIPKPEPTTADIINRTLQNSQQQQQHYHRSRDRGGASSSSHKGYPKSNGGGGAAGGLTSPTEPTAAAAGKQSKSKSHAIRSASGDSIGDRYTLPPSSTSNNNSANNTHHHPKQQPLPPPPQPPETAEDSSKTLTTAALVERAAAVAGETSDDGRRSTGAIPKKKGGGGLSSSKRPVLTHQPHSIQPSTTNNHLDEIISVPIDDYYSPENSESLEQQQQH